MTEKISFNANVKPVCLPENDIPPSPGTNCIVAGWGETENTGDNSILQKAIIPIVDAKRCQAFYDEEGTFNFELRIRNPMIDLVFFKWKVTESLRLKRGYRMLVSSMIRDM